MKTRRQHSNHGVTITIQRERTTDNSRIATESALPEAVSQNRDLWPTLSVFTGLKGSSKNRIDTEHGEEVRTDSRRIEILGIAVATENRAAARVSGNLTNLILLVVLIIGIRELSLTKLLLRCGFK